ncbi:Hypothetical predicted protein [Mytilus galloprovincialis]|uniref:CCHC-type domain-containing protein n=1 Tax=Mytilus galloprovincialis TaxID=29158 RepID=A0A8B6BUP3_MYTGA|nr:Hypothetical predicted protein [Mytilus galloprovincialis]
MSLETSRNGKMQNSYKQTKYMKGGKVFKKECAVKVINIPTRTFLAAQVIEAAEKVCGENSVLAVVPNDAESYYVVTTITEENAEKLTRGLEIDEQSFDCNFQFSDLVVVSFLNLPAHVEDSVIIGKLKEKNCTIHSPIYRHVHPGTQVADGTRYVKVKFPPDLISLSWSMKFDTGYGEKYFKVVHDHQKQLCNMCGSPSHKYRQCPNLICRGCDKQGHKKKECKAKKCDKCDNLPNDCFCPIEDDGTCPYCKYNPCVCVCANCYEKYDECKCHCEGCGKQKEECECSNEEEMDDDVDDEHDVESHPKIEVHAEVHPISKDMSDVNKEITSTNDDDRNGGSDDDGSSSSEDTIEEITENGDRGDDSAKGKEKERSKRSQWCKE